MATATWDTLGQQAINTLPTWEKIFAESGQLIAFKLKVVSVAASGWALGKTPQEIESEAARRLQEGE